MDTTGSTNWLDTKTSTEQKLLLMNGIMCEQAKHDFFWQVSKIHHDNGMQWNSNHKYLVSTNLAR